MVGFKILLFSFNYVIMIRKKRLNTFYNNKKLLKKNQTFTEILSNSDVITKIISSAIFTSFIVFRIFFY